MINFYNDLFLILMLVSDLPHQQLFFSCHKKSIDLIEVPPVTEEAGID